MADQKISELTALTGANVADDDAIAIVDTSATETKKIVFSELKNALDTATGFVRITGDTMTGALDVQSTITADGLTVARAGGSVGSSNVAYIDVTSSYGGLSINASTGNNAFIELMENGVKTAGFNSDATNNVTSVQSANSHALAFNTGSTNERMRIDSSGNVGIGTSSPVRPLNIKTSDSISATLYHNSSSGTTATDGFFVGTSVADAVLWNYENGTMQFATGNTEAMRIDTSGRVLLGTTTEGSVDADDFTISGDNRVGMTIRSANSGSSRIYFSDGTSGAAEYVGYITFDHLDNHMRFGTDAAERLRIDSSGNVGIGTDSPDQLLTVGNTSTQYTRLQFYAATNGASTIHFGDSTAGANPYRGYLNYAHDSDSMQFATSNSERMRIDSSGNVGIGVVPEAWGSAFPSVLQIGAAASLTTSGGDNARLFGNVWYDGTNYKRITSGFAHQYEQTGGTHRWSYAATGAADSTISFSEAMRIDSSGNLLVGESSSSANMAGIELAGNGQLYASTSSASGHFLNIQGSSGNIASFRSAGVTVGSIGTATNEFEIKSSGSRYLELQGIVGLYNSEWTGTLQMTPTVSSVDLGGTGTQWDNLYLSGSIHGDVKFENNAGTTEYARFDGSGNLLVGTTSGNPTGNHEPGTLIFAGGQINVHRDNGNPLRVGNSVDGNLTEYYKQGVLVGNIGVSGNDFFVTGSASNIAGTYFANSKIMPMRSGATSDNTIDLGTSSKRFKDLYLSGGVVFGDAGGSGTSTSNTLDSYEEGTWTPTLPNGGVLGNQGSTYIKIGNTVTVTTYVTSINPTANGNQFQLGGLPFTNRAQSNYYVGGSFGYVGQNNLNDLMPITGVSLDYIYFHENDGNAASITNNGMRAKGLDGASADAMILTITYFT